MRGARIRGAAKVRYRYRYRDRYRLLQINNFDTDSDLLRCSFLFSRQK